MAERRMFAKSVVLEDRFMELAPMARCLYYTLNMEADDDGFVGAPKGIVKFCGAKLADLKQELFNLRFQLAINQLDNPHKIADVKKDIARVMTVIREKKA